MATPAAPPALPNKELLYLGIGLVVGGVIALGAMALSKAFPKVDRKVWVSSASILFGVVMIVLANTGMPSLGWLPGPDSAAPGIVAVTGLCLWVGIVTYVALSTRGTIADLSRALGTNVTDLHKNCEDREKDLRRSIATLDEKLAAQTAVLGAVRKSDLELLAAKSDALQGAVDNKLSLMDGRIDAFKKDLVKLRGDTTAEIEQIHATKKEEPDINELNRSVSRLIGIAEGMSDSFKTMNETIEVLRIDATQNHETLKKLWTWYRGQGGK